MNAMQEEYDSIKDNGTLELLINSTLDLVAKGYSLKEWINYKNNLAPVAKINTN